MFLFGKANEDEIAEMTKMGFDVEPVDINHFDLSLQPDLDLKELDPNRYEGNGDKLVCVFLDYDIVQECRDIKELENASES